MASAAKKPNWFAIIISAAVVVVIVVVAGIVVWGQLAANDPGKMPKTALVDHETGAIKLGDAKGDAPAMQSYVDFMCPVCNQFEQAFGEQLNELSADGKLAYEIVPVAILDRQSQGTEYSSRAANALYCVADEKPKAVVPFFTELFAQQPQEGSEGLPDEKLVEIAKGVDGGDIAKCVKDREFHQLVDFTTKNMPDQDGQRATPTVTWNGDVLQLNEVEGKLATLK